jgi:hypothetical protein
MIERASPAQLRKSLELATLFTKMGIGFVPMPVANSAEYDKLAQQAMDRLAEMEIEADRPTAQGAAALSSTGENNGK